MGLPLTCCSLHMALCSLLLVADWCSGLHAESILTPGLPITGMSVGGAEEVFVSNSKAHGESCDFDTPCPWISSTNMDGKPHWAQTLIGELPLQDRIPLLKNSSRGLDDGILLLNSSQFSDSCLVTSLHSPMFPGSSKTCRLELILYSQDPAALVPVAIIHDKNSNLTNELPPLKDETANQWFYWKLLSTKIGKIDSPFHISLDYKLCNSNTKNITVLDSLYLRNCFGSNHEDNFFSCPWESSFLCNNGECISHMKVCDFQMDCPGGDDEGAICDKIFPHGAHCSFEEGTCSWIADATYGNTWTYTHSLQLDHGEESHSLYKQGYFLYLPTDSEQNVTTASVYSTLFPPVLPNKTCQFSLKFLVRGNLNGTLAAYILEEIPVTNPTQLWQTDGSQSDVWSLATFKVPQLNNRFLMQLVATWGKNSLSHIFVDNITFSADCFKSGRIENSSGEEEGPPERDPWEDEMLNPLSEPATADEKDNMDLRFTSCGARGPLGPTQAQCNNAYRNTNISVVVGKEGPLKGVQIWRVPFTKVYKISAYGAAGGKGAKNHNKRSNGIFISGMFKLEKDDLLYMLVGQQGEDACPGKNNITQELCKGEKSVIEDEYRKKKSLIDWAGGGGGGGGATYVFKEMNGVFIPLLVGAGGGGKAYLEDSNDSSDFEQEEILEKNMAIPGLNGNSGAAGKLFATKDYIERLLLENCDHINKPGTPRKLEVFTSREYMPRDGWEGSCAIKQLIEGLLPENYAHINKPGGGGGWNDITKLPWAGKSLLEGAEGGQSCYLAKASLQWDNYGGFGGGGGPCTSGGGGGGYQGGHASQLDDITTNGNDGVSFINPFGEMFLQPLAATENDGEVHIEVYVNCSRCSSGLCKRDPEHRVVCICEAGTLLSSDNVTCIAPKSSVTDMQMSLPLIFAVLIATVILGVIFACGSLSFVYHRKKKQLEGARVRLQSTEYKLSKIRSSIIMTDYNPNYCFAGKGAGLSELKEVPRKNITLLRALGHGAFGEVYEGLVVGLSGDLNPLQVAIKTLPEICSEQDEMDFLMEALIISKFSHQNIVRCIGVSLQTLPRFILLELMSGGDMKSFLRQNRPWVNQPSSLTMSDLLNMARDIACGCKYLEENHFIHRDIAARNCLLTHTSSGRVAKIGDFGMARDIYRASYYRKGGRAMLPVKWMPPEAFLEGIFTSKTDSWSFGVLLWEILSLGYMPYPCKTNQEVLEFVTSGGRMDPPKNCPGPVYRIMTQCWQHTPDHRPNFSTILEWIIYCTQRHTCTLCGFANIEGIVIDASGLESEPISDMASLGVYKILGNPVQPKNSSRDYFQKDEPTTTSSVRLESLTWKLCATKELIEGLLPQNYTHINKPEKPCATKEYIEGLLPENCTHVNKPGTPRKPEGNPVQPKNSLRDYFHKGEPTTTSWDPDVINMALPIESGPAPEDEGNIIMRPTCNSLKPLMGDPSLPAKLDTHTMDGKLGNIPEELRVENLVSWNLREPTQQCAADSTESSLAQSNLQPTETKPQISHKLKNKSKDLWNPTYGSWVMESNC